VLSLEDQNGVLYASQQIPFSGLTLPEQFFFATWFGDYWVISLEPK
jgi:hypothetical protein